MTLLSTIKQNEQNRDAIDTKACLERLIQSDQYVGDVYSIGYEFAKCPNNHDFLQKKSWGYSKSLFFGCHKSKEPDEEAS